MRALKRSARSLALILILALVMSLGANAAENPDFPDAAGHWAEPYLRAAVREGLLAGDDRGLLAPDDPATMAQTLTILCRLLWPGSTVTAEELEMPSGAWYSDYAASARAMGIDFDISELKGGSFSRGRAFQILAQAFRLLPAEPDYTALEAFSDCEELTDAERPAAAAMAAAGFVNGSQGRLMPRASVSRAELVTMLLRMAEQILDEAPEELSGRSVLKSAAGLSGKRYEGTLWLTRDAGEADLSGLTAGTVVILSGDDALKVDSATSIDRLVLAGGSGDTLELNPGRVGTLVIAPGAPKNITVHGKVDTVELTGDGHVVTLRSSSSRLVISGRGNDVTVNYGFSGSVAFTGSSEENTVTSYASLSDARLDGRLNSLTLRGGCSAATVGGVSCTLSGGAYIRSLTVTSRTATLRVSGSRKNEYPTGAEGLDFSLKVPASFDVSGPLSLEATVTGFEEAGCTLAWYLDGQPVSTQEVALTAGTSVLTCDLPVELYDGMAGYRLVSAVLTYADGSSLRRTAVTELIGVEDLLAGAGVTLVPEDHALNGHVTVKASVTNPLTVSCTASWYVQGRLLSRETVRIGPEPVTLTLDKDLDYTPDTLKGRVELRLTLGSSTASAAADAPLTNVTVESALAAVTSDYAGDYTLEWAQAHDYDQLTKTVWVNAKGYASDTQYLVWVNRTYQRVNVFQGSAGNWTLVKTFLCGTGSPGRATPVSVSKVRSHRPQGWTFPTYIVRPVVYFLTGGYAFHSRLWNKSHTALVDANIGFPVSHGCVRMYDEDLQWIYDNIPDGTTVVVH